MTFEESVVTGGFGSAVLEAARGGAARPTRRCAIARGPDHRHPGRPVRRPRVRHGPAPAASASTSPGLTAQVAETLAPARGAPRSPSQGADRRLTRAPARGMRRGQAALCHDRRVSRPATGARPRSGSTSCSSSAGWPRRAAARRRWCWPARSGSGQGDAARLDRKAGDLVDPRRRVARGAPDAVRQPRRRTSSRPRSTRSGSTRRASSASTSAPRPAASPTCCCSAARRRVYALDVGRGQLAERAAPRPARRLDGAHQRPDARPRPTLPEPVDLAVDRRLVHLARLVLGPVARRCATAAAPIVALVKPQFEAGRAGRDRGVVRDPAIHRGVLERVVAAAAASSASARATSSRRRSWARRATASSSSTCGRAGCAEIDDRIDEAVAAAWARRAGDDVTSPHRVRLQPDDRGRRSSSASARPAGAGCAASTSGQSPAGDTDGARARAARRPTSLVVLGGDGTFLRAVRAVAEVDVPILGINLGKVGFLSKAEADELDVGPRQARRRRALRARRADGASTGAILRGGRPRRRDASPRSTTSSSRAARWRASAGSTSSIDDTHLATFIADGLVVASPTGSTGYSFSAGGPILDPLSRNLVVTPIAAYLSAIRSVVGQPAPDRPLHGRRRARGARLDRRPRGHPRSRSATSSRCAAVERPIRLIEPAGRAAVLGPAPPQGGAAAVVTGERARGPPPRADRSTDLALIDRLRLTLDGRASTSSPARPARARAC